METLTKLEQVEHNLRQRAWQYEQVQNELDRLRGVVARVTPQLDALTGIVRQLAEINQLAAKLTPDLAGTGGGTCRDQIRLSIADAEKSLVNKRARLQRQLEPALERIPSLERQIEEFNRT